MARRINFINPFGTQAYDALIYETLSHYASTDTELVITHLEGCPADADYFYPKHLIELALLEAIQNAEEMGFDAVISGCCYDPAVRVGREVANIPVIGPMEASLQMANYFGKSSAVVADHRKACEYMQEYARTTGLDGNVRGYEVIDWYVRDMIKNPDAVARDVISVAASCVEKNSAECLILNCTIIAACYQKHLMKGGERAVVPILNPNLMALKMAEGLADLYKADVYEIGRTGYYMRPPQGHYESVSLETRRAWKETVPTLRGVFNA